MSGDATRLPDAEARSRAATDFASNLVVMAGAGTGKTSLVVERLLNAVGAGIVDLDRLAAITFTEKAAGEMRERLATGLDRLRGLARGESTADLTGEAGRAFAYLTGQHGVAAAEIGARALAAMELLDRSTVTTIHGFCSELLRRYPVEAGVDPDFSVDTGEHAASLGLLAWDAFVIRELGPEATRAELWTGILDRFPLSTLRAVALDLAGFAVPDATLRPPITAPDPRHLLGDELALRIAEIDDLLARQSEMTVLAKGYFAGVRRLFVAFREEGTCGFRRAWAADGDTAERVRKNNVPQPGKKLENVRREEMKRLVSRTRALAVALERVDDELLTHVVEAVAPFALEFREEFLRRGFVSFDGLLSLARDLLRDHQGVRQAVKERYRMLLIDEFQDTDPVQHEVALYLGERPEAFAGDPYDVELLPGRLFVVGDAKQSIYRFRGADYAAYHRAVKKISPAGDQTLDLVANFRSVPGVVEAANRLFTDSGGVWEASDYQPDYVPIRAVRSADGDAPAVELWTVDVPGGSKAEVRREAEGRLLAQSIRHLVEEQQACRYRDITILFRAFTNITHYLRPLRKEGVPFVVDGGREFLERPEVSQLMALLRTLSQPADAPALLACLRSPAGGVSDVELADFKDAGGRFDWRVTDGQPAGRVADCLGRLRALAVETRHLPADTTVHRVVERMLLLPLGAAAFEGPQRVANLTKLAAAAGELARDGRLSLEQVVEALREGRLADIESDRPLSDDAAEAVRITSIHRMKGLENDWIFLPDMARQDSAGRGVPRPVCVARPPGIAPTLALRTAGAHGVASCARVWLDDEGQRHERAEETRVLYVALTRARKRLVLLASPSSRPTPWIEALRPWGYDAATPPADGAVIADGAVLHRTPSLTRSMAAPAVAPAADAEQAARDYEAAVHALRAAAVPPLAAPSGLGEDVPDAPRPRARNAAIERRDMGRALGVVIHRLLERWPADRPAQTELAAELVEAVASAEGVDPAALGRETAALLGSFAGSPLSAELNRIDVVARELPILLRGDDGRVYRGTIDLLYRDAGGGLVVADYKTDREADEQTLRTRYGRQLDAYALGVARALRLAHPPRTELWLLQSGSILALSAPGP